MNPVKEMLQKYTKYPVAFADHGGGAHLSLPNGWTVSVQWLSPFEGTAALPKGYHVLYANPETSAEVWAWDRHGKGLKDVKGHQHVAQVKRFISYIARKEA